MESLEWKNTQEPVPKTDLYKRNLLVGWNAVLHRDAGLTNLGNTCFLNATIQALFHIPSFLDFLSAEYLHTKKCLDSLSCLTCALYRTWLNLKLHSVTVPMSILLLLPKLGRALVRGQQNDAHEFLNGLLSGIEAEMLARHPPVDFCSQQTTVIGKIFGAWLCNTIKCETCETESVTYFPQSDIFVETDQVSSLQDAIDNFLKPEVLDDNTCEVCGDNKIKQVKYWSYPKVLQIVIKRFEFDTRVKLNGRVSINKSLQLGKTHSYKFLSAVLHHGSSMDSGHYTCAAACPNQLISLFNDAQVTSLGEDFLDQKELTEGAYIIFYELRKVVKTLTQEHQETEPIPPNVQEPVKKRDLPKSPTKISPLQKNLAAASPSSLFPTMTNSLAKLGSTIHSVSCLTNDSDNTSLSEHSYSKKLLDTDDSSEKINDKTVPPVKIRVHTRENPKPSESLHSYRIADETAKKQMNERAVSPLTIAIRTRDNPKPSESLHSYGVANKTENNQTNDKRVAPVKITIRPRENPKPSESLHSYKIADKTANSNQRTAKTVPPIVVQKRRREDPQLSESLHSYKIIDRKEKEKKSSHDCNIIKNNSEMAMTRASKIRNSLLKVMESTRELSLQARSDEKVTDETADINMDMQDFEADVRGNESPPVPSHGKYFPILAANVRGTKLPKSNVKENIAADLATWLRIRGIPTSRLNKKTLVALVDACVDIGRDHILDPSQATNSQGIAGAVEIQIPTTGWDTFPSREIPINFNFGSVYHYLVETMPVYEGDDPLNLQPNSSDEEEEEESENDGNMHDPFENCEKDAMLQSKKMRRGLLYIKSKFVRIIEDCIEGRLHYFKAHVRGSYRKIAYWVHVAISQISGRVVFCSCDKDCIQRALGRCSHVSGMLLGILIHTRLNGYQGKFLNIFLKFHNFNVGNNFYFDNLDKLRMDKYWVYCSLGK